MLWKVLGLQKLLDALFDDNWLGASCLPEPVDHAELMQALLGG